MTHPRILSSLPLLLLVACHGESGHHGSGPPDDDPSLPANGPVAGLAGDQAVDRASTDGQTCKTDEDCEDAKGGPFCVDDTCMPCSPQTNEGCETAEGGPICFEGACLPCSPSDNEGCLEGEYCSPTRLKCLPGCDDVGDCNGYLCTNGECTDYYETTPICNYLERGIDDFDGTSDRYALAPVNVRTLADIERLAFGEDIPPDRCLDPLHSFPCRDKDIHDDWCIRDVELSVLGFTLFSAAADASGCLFVAQGGSSGVKEISGDELRSNEYWGFDTDDLLQLFRYVTFDEEGNIGIVPDGYTIPGEDVARMIEGIIGVQTAAYNKGEANDSYHDNRRGFTAFFASESKVDCDFGDCPAIGARSSSPWVELRKTDDGKIAVDVDMEFMRNSVAWPQDCIDNPDINEGGVHCGNLSTSLGHGSMGFDVDVVCEEMNNGTYAIQVEVSDPTFEPEGGLLAVMPELCGFIASIAGGHMVSIIGYTTWCEDKATEVDPANILETYLGDSLRQNLLGGLDSCPEIAIGDDGTIAFDTHETIECTDADCMGQPARVAPDVTFAYDATSATVETERFVHLLKDVAPPPPEPQAGKEWSAKTIDLGLSALCALQATCDDVAQMDFETLDVDVLRELIENPPEGTPASTEPEAFEAWLGEDLYAKVQAFANQAQIQEHCVDPITLDPAHDNNIWLAETFVAFEGQCSDLPPFEALLPATLVELEIQSNAGVTDNYPFVDFSDPSRKNWSALAGSACRHLYDETFEQAPPSWQNCAGDPQDPAYFGQRGCPCADVNISVFDDILVDGGRSDGPGSYRVHGNAGPGQFCDDDSAIQGSEVVCGLSETHHAECQECGLDTNLGCSCLYDTDCEGIENDLTCIGDAEDGWGPGATGTCLPEAHQSVSKMPWFCLESCGAIVSSGQMGCLYDQTENVTLSHGQCVNVDGAYDDPGAWGTCVEDGMFWEDDAVCAMECTSTAQCADRGFPGEGVFLCDFEYGWSPGRCVPQGCQSMDLTGDVLAMCELYR